MTNEKKPMPTFVEYDENENGLPSSFDLPLFIQTPKLREGMERAVKRAEEIEHAAER